MDSGQLREHFEEDFGSFLDLFHLQTPVKAFLAFFKLIQLHIDIALQVSSGNNVQRTDFRQLGLNFLQFFNQLACGLELQPIDAEPSDLSKLLSIVFTVLAFALLDQAQVEKLQVDGFRIVVFG